MSSMIKKIEFEYLEDEYDLQIVREYEEKRKRGKEEKFKRNRLKKSGINQIYNVVNLYYHGEHQYLM